MNYLLNTQDQQKAMLEVLGLNALEELYQSLPQDLILTRPLAIAEGLSEFEVIQRMKSLASKNTIYHTVLRGAGAEQHYIPSLVSELSSREEFVTAYTPYQAEMSQGLLQSIFEYQTSMCELTGMDVCNASVYDGATAAAEAIQMVIDRKKRKVLVADTLHPQVIHTMQTYIQHLDVELILLENKDGLVDLKKLKDQLSEEIAAVFIQSPNYNGCLEAVEAIAQMTHAAGAKLVQHVNPLTLGLLKSPRAQGVDIAIGEAQSLGIPLSFGGPYLGFMSASADLVRKLPGRIAGETKDLDGKRAFTLTLQAREQHIRREKSTSSICSNQALMALTASMYLASMGPQGMRDVATACTSKAHYFIQELEKIGFKRKYNSEYFHECVTLCPISAQAVETLLDKHGILSGLILSEHEMLWCVTETSSKQQLDQVVELLKEALS